MVDYLTIAREFGIKQAQMEDSNFCDIINYNDIKKGMGITIGNALRRVLLDKVPGCAITSLKIAGIQHEFSVIPGVKEDVQQLIMNLKKVVFKSDVNSLKATLNVSKEGVVTAGDISVSSCEVINKEIYICSIEKGFELKVELLIEKGIGIKRASHKLNHDTEIGSIALNAFFSPVISVNFKVEEKENMHLEDLDVEIITNGSIAPKEAFNYALDLLYDQFNKTSAIEKSEEVVNHSKSEVVMETISPSLYIEIKNISGFSGRILNCFKQLGIVYVGDLVQYSKEDLLNSPNFWENSLNTVVDVLSTMDLELGMKINWPPKDLEEKVKEINSKAII